MWGPSEQGTMTKVLKGLRGDQVSERVLSRDAGYGFILDHPSVICVCLRHTTGRHRTTRTSRKLNTSSLSAPLWTIGVEPVCIFTHHFALVIFKKVSCATLVVLGTHWTKWSEGRKRRCGMRSLIHSLLTFSHISASHLCGWCVSG